MLLTKSTAENCQEFELGKTTINGGALLPLLLHSILQNQGKTAVLPVLPPMAPLPLVLEVPQSDVKRVQLVKGSHVKE